ncbi:MAG: AAA family ATPase [Chlorobia bacterium]|nr:AAA family ATPase [Fimbriimonadaceae bacterium]
MPADEYLGDDEELDVEWVVKDMLPRSFLVVLGGGSKSGKSCLVTAMAHAITRGEPFLGKETEQGVVLWCAFEESKMERKLVLSKFGDREDHPNLVIAHDLPKIDTPEGLEVLRKAIERYKPSLIVIDPLYGAHSQESLSGGTSGRNCLEGLKKLCADYNVAAIVIHHFTKNVGAGLTRERMADSGQILAAASMDILMDSVETDDGFRLIRLKAKGRGGFASFDWRILSRSVTEFELLEAKSGAAPDPSADDAILACLNEALAPLSASEVHEKTGIPLQTVRNNLTALKNKGQLMVEKHGREYYYGAPV